MPKKSLPIALVALIYSSISGCGVQMRDLSIGSKSSAVQPSAVVLDLSYHLKTTQYTSCIVRTGKAYCWGDNTYGQLGDGTQNNGLVPTALPVLTSGVTAISPGGVASSAVMNGALYTWGSAGYTGDGGSANQYSPIPAVNLTSGVTQTSSGGYSSCAIQNGAAFCWGENGAGQLGNNTTTSSTTPVAVSGLTSNVSTIAVDAGTAFGSSFACAIQNGGLFCWGANQAGQLGNNSTTSSSVPVAVTGMGSGVTDVAPGTSHTCAIKSGTAYCWGSNDVGQSGDGTTTAHLVPAPVVGLPGTATKLYSSNGYSCALVGGSAWCWGGNAYGQLGNGTSGGGTSSTTPMQATILGSGITEMSLSFTNGSAVINGVGISWGSNSHGSIGNNTSGAAVYLSPQTILSWPQ